MAASAQTIIDNIDDAIAAYMAGGAIQSYSVNGRNLSRCSLSELKELRTYYVSVANAGTSTRSLAGYRSPR